MTKRLLGAGLALMLLACTPKYDVVIVGGGAGGTTAAIEAARSGANVLVVEPTPWLGGMLTSAGVSAIDGNYRLRGGLFGEFTDSLALRYGGYENLKSGWVSNILFNPAVGAQVLRDMADKAGVELRMETGLRDARSEPGMTKRPGISGWNLTLSDGSRVKARILIDGTELGDVARMVGAEELKDRVATQDMTYVAIVKEFQEPVTPVKPEGYDPAYYSTCCDSWNKEMVLNYGKLPDGHYMLNWPQGGNDIWIEYIDMSPEERAQAFKEAKLRTLGFIYYLQTELGFSHIGLADDIYPTEDRLPFFPYFRDAWRIAGRDTMTVEAAKDPYRFDLYTRAVAVGDYPVDHHHKQHPRHEELEHLWFGKIPSFSVPLGVIIPIHTDNFLVADKAMSSSWEMNGATRLQPVVMGVGQAAGALAALAVKKGVAPHEVPVSEVQSLLLDHGCYLLPFLDLKPYESGFRELQEKGIRGEVKGIGRTVGWANETWVKLPENE